MEDNNRETIFSRFIKFISDFGYYIEKLDDSEAAVDYGILRIHSPLYTQKTKHPLTLTVMSKNEENYLKLSTTGFFKIQNEELNLMLQTCAVLNISVAPIIFQYNYIEKSVEIFMPVYLCDLEVTQKLAESVFVQVSQAADITLELFEETRNRRSLLTNEEMQEILQRNTLALGERIQEQIRLKQQQQNA